MYIYRVCSLIPRDNPGERINYKKNPLDLSRRHGVRCKAPEKTLCVISRCVIFLVLFSTLCGVLTVVPASWQAGSDKTPSTDVIEISPHTSNMVWEGGAGPVVNEVYSDPSLDLNGDGLIDQLDEFIELYNPTGSTIDLQGWLLRDNAADYTINATCIQPGEHLLFWRMITDLKLGRDDLVELVDLNGSIMDRMVWEGLSRGLSFQRTPDGSEMIRRVEPPSPGGSNNGEPEIVINEVLVDPEGANLGFQWVEILNTGQGESMEGVVLTNCEGVECAMPGTFLAPMERAIVVFGDASDLPPHPSSAVIVNGQHTKTLYVNGDDLALITYEGYVLDYVAWGNSSHISPPVDTLGRCVWRGDIWDARNGTMVTGEGPNPVPRTGISLMRKDDGSDSDLPSDWSGNLHQYPCTPGWNNELDPSIDIHLDATETWFSKGEKRDIVIILNNTGNLFGEINVSIFDLPDEWEIMDPPGSILELAPGEGTIEMFSIRAPSSLKFNRTADIRVRVFHVGMEFLQFTVPARFVIPAIDISIDDISMEWEGRSAEIVPRGAFVEISGTLVSKGELDPGTTDIRISVLDLGAPGEKEMQCSSITFKSLVSSSRRTFEFVVDTISCTGPVRIDLLADPLDLLNEPEEDDNLWSETLILVDSPPLPGQMDLMMDQVLWNCTDAETFVSIINTGEAAVDLSGMLISDGTMFGAFPEGIFLRSDERAVVVWGNDARERAPESVSTFWMNGGPSGSRMKLSSGVPDLFETGMISLLSRYRIPVDKVALKRSLMSIDPGVNGTPAEATWGTVIVRRMDGDLQMIDLDSPFDWNVKEVECSIDSFLVAPDIDSCGEFIRIRTDLNSTDLSGVMLSCNGRVSVLPNGTLPDDDGYLTVSMDPDQFFQTAGKLPMYTSGMETDGYPGAPIPTGIPGYQGILLPNSGGNLLLLDAGNRVIDSVSWGSGDHSDILAPGKDVVTGRIFNGSSGRSIWMASGTGKMIAYWTIAGQHSDTCEMVEFGSILKGLRWLGDNGPVTVITAVLDDPVVLSFLRDRLHNGFDVEIILMGEPWNELEGVKEDSHPMMTRTGLIKDLHDLGACIRYMEGSSTGSGTSMLVSSERQLWLSGPLMASAGTSDLGQGWVVGLRTEDTGIAQEIEQYYGSISRDGSDLMELIQTRNGPESFGFVFDPDEETPPTWEGSVGFGEWTERGSGLLNGEYRLVIGSGPFDAGYILEIARSGHPVRILLAPEVLRVYGECSVKEPSGLQGDDTTVNCSLDIGSLLSDHLASIRELLMVSSLEGLDVEARSSDLDTGLLGSYRLTMTSDRIYLPLPSPGRGYIPCSVTVSFPEAEDSEDRWDQVWLSSNPFPWDLFPREERSDLIEDDPGVLIEEIYYDTYLVDDPDEYIALKNHGNAPVDLNGYLLTDCSGDEMISDGTLMIGNVILEPGKTLFIAREGASFAGQNGFEPDVHWWGPNASSGAICLSGDLRLSNTGDGVYLRNPSGKVVDSILWGGCGDDPNLWNSFASGQWKGEPVGDIGWGHVLFRVDRTSNFIPLDTNSADDLSSLRPRYPGQSRFELFPMRELDYTRFGFCPLSSSRVLEDALSGASEEILVNVYEFTSSWIASSLIGARSRGIRVKVMMEGNPVGGISLMEKIAISKMLMAGIEVRLITTDTTSNIRDRYRYDHAKYVIIDGKEVLISTDNFKDTSFPPPGVSVDSGTRGWILHASSREMAKDLLRVFEEDYNGPDMFVPGVDHEILELEYPEVQIENTGIHPSWSGPHGIHGPVSGRIVVSPDHLSPEEGPLLDLIRSAREEILLELMDLKVEYLLGTMPNWTVSEEMTINTSVSQISALNPFVRELVDAASRGVMVRILLDGSDFNGDGVEDNRNTISLLREIFDQSGSGAFLEVMLHPTPRFYYGGETSMIHNKGMVVDGDKVWISSFNWGPTSGLENREVGAIIDSPEMAGICRQSILFDMGGSLQELYAISGIWAKGDFEDSGEVLIETGFHFEWKGDMDCRLELVYHSLNEADKEDEVLSSLDIPSSTKLNVHMDAVLGSGIGDGVVIVRIVTGNIHYDATTISPLEAPENSGIPGPPLWSSPWVPLAMILGFALGISIIMAVVKRRKDSIQEE